MARMKWISKGQRGEGVAGRGQICLFLYCVHNAPTARAPARVKVGSVACSRTLLTEFGLVMC